MLVNDLVVLIILQVAVAAALIMAEVTLKELVDLAAVEMVVKVMV